MDGEIDNSIMLLREPVSPRCRAPSSSESRILYISQKMRQEAEEILFHESVFFLISGYTRSSNISQALVDRIAYLDIHTRSTQYPTAKKKPEILHIYSVFRKFSNIRIERKCCSDTIDEAIGFPVLSTRLFSTIKGFIEFETVIIRVICPIQKFEGFSDEKLSRGSREAKWPPTQLQDDKDTMEMLWWFGERRNAFKTGLESTLGLGETYDKGYDMVVEFHPLHHSSRQLG